MENPDNGLVLLVAMETITPYKKGEVFGVSPETAEKLLTRDMTMTDFGPKYPVVKVRRYIPEQDEELLLQNHTLNQKETTSFLQSYTQQPRSAANNQE